MEALPFAGVADLAGRFAAELDRIGQPIGLADTRIASIALKHGLELVTGNSSDFRRVQQLGSGRPPGAARIASETADPRGDELPPDTAPLGMVN